MTQEYTMSEEDRKMWDGLMEWGIRWVACNLERAGREQEEILKQNPGYHDTILGLEVHDFFGAGESQAPTENLSDIRLEGTLFALQRRLELNEFELFCVILAMLGELDYHFEKLFVYLNNDWNQRLLSVEWAIRLFTMGQEPDSFFLSYLQENGKLATWVFDVRTEEAGSGLRKGLKLKATVLEFLLRSGAFCDKAYLKWNPAVEENLQSWLQEEICKELETAGDEKQGAGKKRIFHLRGEDSWEKLLYAAWYAQHKGRELAMMDGRCMEEESESESYHAAIEEVVLAGGILCIHHAESMQQGEKNIWKLSRFLQEAAEHIADIFLLDNQEHARLCLPWKVDDISIALTRPTGSRKQQIWEQMAKDYPISGDALQQALSIYDFGIEEIERSLSEARRIAYKKNKSKITAAILHEACRRQLKENLKEWASLVETVYTWEDIILPQEQKEELEDAVNQIKYRQQVYEEWGFSNVMAYGRGLSILLTGPPGTGKTMAAQVLAGALEMKLYKVQLPAVVSKYIGETEKNLKSIFREGRKSPAVLFFDEADVLFSKRTEVKDSHDKYSNMEAAFLLQNMEEYSGVVILATNFPQNIDEAFKRRIKYTFEFYMPDVRQRYQLWKQSFPTELPMDADVDLEYLAERFDFSGSNIKNIAINAAFLAAPAKEPVGMAHILKALRREYRKSGKYLSEEELMSPGFC